AFVAEPALVAEGFSSSDDIDKAIMGKENGNFGAVAAGDGKSHQSIIDDALDQITIELDRAEVEAALLASAAAKAAAEAAVVAGAEVAMPVVLESELAMGSEAENVAEDRIDFQSMGHTAQDEPIIDQNLTGLEKLMEQAQIMLDETAQRGSNPTEMGNDVVPEKQQPDGDASAQLPSLPEEEASHGAKKPWNKLFNWGLRKSATSTEEEVANTDQRQEQEDSANRIGKAEAEMAAARAVAAAEALEKEAAVKQQTEKQYREEQLRQQEEDAELLENAETEAAALAELQRAVAKIDRDDLEQTTQPQQEQVIRSVKARVAEKQDAEEEAALREAIFSMIDKDQK
ncbi:MAG: hypothetical protein RR387_04140, partial [Clostridiales bacterium]